MPKHVRTLKSKRAVRILPALSALYDADTATASEINISPVDALSIESEGLIKRVNTRQTGKRGRPAIEYRLTDKGRKRVKRARG
jgi:predicted ArsR family transcriptional regulator